MLRNYKSKYNYCKLNFFLTLKNDFREYNGQMQEREMHLVSRQQKGYTQRDTLDIRGDELIYNAIINSSYFWK